MPAAVLLVWRHRRGQWEFEWERAGWSAWSSRSREKRSAAATMSYAFWRLLDAIAGKFWRLEPPGRCYTTQESGVPDRLLLLALWLETRSNGGDGLWLNPATGFGRLLPGLDGG